MPFKLDNKFFTVIGKLTNLILLNLLCIVCCLPVITAGPAICAMYFCMGKLVRKEHIHIVQGFWKSLKENMKQGILLELIAAAVGCLLYFNLQLVLSSLGAGILFKIIAGILIFIIFLFLLMLTYLFPVQAQFANTIKATLYNALMLAVYHLPRSLIMLCLNVLPVILFFIWTKGFLFVFPFYIFIGFAVTAYINCLLLRKIFEPYCQTKEAGEE